MKIRTKSFESLAPPLETKHSLCNRLSLAIRNGHRMRAIGGTSYGGAGRRIQRHQLRKNRAAQLLRKVGGFDHLYLRRRRRSAPASVLSYANNADLNPRVSAKQLDRGDRNRTLTDRSQHRIEVLPLRVAGIDSFLPLAAWYCALQFAG